jgi:hypothetical protein
MIIIIILLFYYLIKMRKNVWDDHLRHRWWWNESSFIVALSSYCIITSSFFFHILSFFGSVFFCNEHDGVIRTAEIILTKDKSSDYTGKQLPPSRFFLSLIWTKFCSFLLSYPCFVYIYLYNISRKNDWSNKNKDLCLKSD